MSGDGACLVACAGEREGEGVRLRAQVSGGKWASGARGSKRARTCGGGRRTRGRGRVHGEGRGREVGDGLTGGVRGRACERNDVDKTVPLGSGRERGERARGRDRLTGGVHLSSRAGAQARARAGPTWANWATLAFLISREFLMPFLLIFCRVFNSNSNQVSNSNEIKHVQQFKEYLELNKKQHFMTHIVLTK
jgi:hypothetical protein